MSLRTWHNERFLLCFYSCTSKLFYWMNFIRLRSYAGFRLKYLIDHLISRQPVIRSVRFNSLNHATHYAAFRGCIFSKVFFWSFCATHRSTARWALSQNSGVLPNSLDKRNAMDGETALRSRRISFTVWRDTPNLSAKLDAFNP